MPVEAPRPSWTALAHFGTFTAIVGAWVLWELGAHNSAHWLRAFAIVLAAAPIVALTLRRRGHALSTTTTLRVERILFILLLGLATASFIAWSAHFIKLSSTRGPDRRIYYALFDDAMITMRYAWNLAHGAGCVWNPGERVEGFTSPLMMLLMTAPAAVFEKSRAVLAVQIAGGALVIVTALFTSRIAQALFELEPAPVRRGLGGAVFAATLFYYPLSYWSLMGMETSVLAALVAVATATLLERGSEPRIIPAFPILCGLLFWTRPDALVQASLLLGARALLLGRGGLRIAIREAAIFTVFVAVSVGARRAYFGAWVPNTYTLKLTGLPLTARLQDGVAFITPFLERTWPLFMLSWVGIAARFGLRTLTLATLPVSVVIYQVWVGGDPWLYWRIPAPYLPMLFATAMLGIVAPVARLRTWLDRRNQRRATEAPSAEAYLPLPGGPLLSAEAMGACAVAMLGVLVCRVNTPFVAQQTFRQPAYLTGANHKLVGIGVALARIIKPEARLGVLWAGVLPYYAGGIGIDFLGKTDPHVARLPPDPNAGFNGLRSVPGHNKYDLHYSIGELRPDYVQKTQWLRHNLTAFVRANYVEVQGLWLLRGSPNVRWDLLPVTTGESPKPPARPAAPTTERRQPERPHELGDE